MIGPILVTGSRAWDDGDFLAAIIHAHRHTPLGFVHGGCSSGVDAYVAAYCHREQLACLSYPADWTRYGKAAGVLRNIEMLERSKPSKVLAFWDGSSKGTAHMVRIATQAGVDVALWTKRPGERGPGERAIGYQELRNDTPLDLLFADRILEAGKSYYTPD